MNRMIDAGLSDGEIMNRTGHRSSTTIAKYRRINETNAAAASSALTIGGRRQAVQQVLPSSVPVTHTMSSSTSSPMPAFDMGISQLIPTAESQVQLQDTTDTVSDDLFDDDLMPDQEALDKIIAEVLQADQKKLTDGSTNSTTTATREMGVNTDLSILPTITVTGYEYKDTVKLSGKSIDMHTCQLKYS